MNGLKSNLKEIVEIAERNDKYGELLLQVNRIDAKGFAELQKLLRITKSVEPTISPNRVRMKFK